ncbi:MAG: phytoene/squalene synthase family protein [Calditrichaceae bacterium]
MINGKNKLFLEKQYCLEMLPKVSRTFAPTIKMLPAGLNVPVTVAYLLCRIADTVEDNEDLSIEQKKKMLDAYARIFDDSDLSAQSKFMKLVPSLSRVTPDDDLLYNLPVVLDVYFSFSEGVRRQIGKWVTEMSLGMRKYAQSSKKRRFTFLRTMKELDEYTYYVAGTVGYLLTELFSHYSRKITPAVRGKLEQLAESFGKGLQMVNIIRDMTVDLRRGQSYIPDELLKKYRLTRQSIFKEENADQAVMMFNELIQNAVSHLDKALDYILLIPKEEKRIRLFCMLPLFWALRTLQKIHENTLSLLGEEKVKVSRKMIRRELYLAFINMYSNTLMRRHYQQIRKQFDVISVSSAA